VLHRDFADPAFWGSGVAWASQNATGTMHEPPPADFIEY